MGNHTIDCDYCGEDTRGLGGVRGCNSQSEAEGCYTYKKNKALWDQKQTPLEIIREHLQTKLARLPAFNSEEEQAAYVRGAEAMRQRCADHLQQRAQEEAERSRMITSAACSRLAQEVADMNVVVPKRAENW